VAEPWTDDFVALDERSRIQPRSLAATRAHFLSTSETTKMQFFKNRPLLALMIVLALAGVASGAAYAVHEVFLSVDPDKSAQEIETDVQDQLQAAGVNASVHADKSDDRVAIRIATADEDLKTYISTPEGNTETGSAERTFMLEVDSTLTEAQRNLASKALQSKPVLDALAGDANATTLADVIKRELTNVGFHEVTVDVLPDAIKIRILR